MPTPVRRYTNSYPHAEHGLSDVLRWKFGFGPKEVSPFTPEELATSQLQSVPPNWDQIHHPISEQVQLTWIGHSSFLLQHHGLNLLIDPIFSDHCAPVPLPTLKRALPPGLPLKSLPEIHGLAISHCHYDHLDKSTIQHFGNRPVYWLPEGLSPWFQRLGIDRVTELPWWQSREIAPGLTIHSVPAQHFAARTPFDRNRTHWCGWVFRSAERSIYFAGDTGYCPVFKEIGARFGGFDVAMIPIGAYRPRWFMHPVHVDSVEAVQIHLDTRSKLSLACHWGTFKLTDESLNEPPLLLERALAEKQIPPAQFRTLKIGETIIV